MTAAESCVRPVKHSTALHCSSLIRSSESPAGTTSTLCLPKISELNPPKTAAYWSCFPPLRPMTSLSRWYARAAVSFFDMSTSSQFTMAAIMETIIVDDPPSPEPAGASERMIRSNPFLTSK